jgi:ribosomal protein S18 acetylase RimI-like enzyme|tara:strand:+ start:365 stop:853 length:489 start_codon:yes stop_codon:yes gene_type:complete
MKYLPKPDISIFPYRAELKGTFYSLNAEWLEAFFLIEPYDLKVLRNPQEMILDPGGEIYFAANEGEVVATFALVPRAEGSVELNKMAVRKDQRGLGIGNELMDYIIERCQKRGVRSLELYSNTKLKNAIHLYRKYGFKEIAIPQDCFYERANIRMELRLLSD